MVRTVAHRSCLSRLRYVRRFLIEHLLDGRPVADFPKTLPVSLAETLLVFRSMSVLGMVDPGAMKLDRHCTCVWPDAALVLKGSSPTSVGGLVFLSPKEESFGDSLNVSLRPELIPTIEYESSSPLSGPEQCFRHSGWARRRSQLWKLLSSGGIASTNALRSFCNCGAEAVVMYSPSTGRFRVQACYCHSRFCEPCARSRAGRVAATLRTRAKGLHCRFLTLTMAHSSHALSAQIDRLRDHFATFRHHKEWKSHVTGGACTLEVKLTSGGEWHPHLHILFAGDWWDTRKISALWRKITGDSFIVKIKDCGTDLPRYVGYVCSYISKPNKAGDVFSCPERLLEMMSALKGRRLIDLLGDWRGWPKDEETAYLDPDDWRRVASVDALWKAASCGEQWALAVLKNVASCFVRSTTEEEADLFAG